MSWSCRTYGSSRPKHALPVPPGNSLLLTRADRGHWPPRSHRWASVGFPGPARSGPGPRLALADSTLTACSEEPTQGKGPRNANIPVRSAPTAPRPPQRPKAWQVRGAGGVLRVSWLGRGRPRSEWPPPVTVAFLLLSLLMRARLGSRGSLAATPLLPEPRAAGGAAPLALICPCSL